jgi:hypothetical protein
MHKTIIRKKTMFFLKSLHSEFFCTSFEETFFIMPAPVMSYNPNERECKLIADDLGLLQRAVDNGTHTKLPDAHYSCFEFAALEEPVLPGCVYRKKDVSGQGKGLRTQNRVIIPMNTATNKVVEGVAYYWRHDNRVMKLSAEYFKHAETYRYM